MQQIPDKELDMEQKEPVAMVSSRKGIEKMKLQS